MVAESENVRCHSSAAHTPFWIEYPASSRRGTFLQPAAFSSLRSGPIGGECRMLALFDGIIGKSGLV